MQRLRKSFSKGLRISAPLLLTLLFSACDEPIIYNELRYADITGEVWEGYNPNKIRIRCGKDCAMLAFARESVPLASFDPPLPNTEKLLAQQRLIIHHFLRKQNRNTLVYIAPCDTGPVQRIENKKLAHWVADEAIKAGYSVWITKPVIPFLRPAPLFCVNLLRGPLGIIPPSCPNMRVKDSVYHVASDFGCSTNRTLATMINPWDFLAPPGGKGPVPAARITHGNMDYNDGKRAKILIPRPYRTNSDYN